MVQLAMCITGMGRELIKVAKNIAEDISGGEVVYIDTDAIFL
jgi:DNA polymerase elongation subunit (family B)